MSNKIELLEKLRRLTESPNEHERKSAEKKLNEIMKKYNIDELQLAEETLDTHTLYYHNRYEESLILQILFKFFGKSFGDKTYTQARVRGKNIRLYVKCTYQEFLEISVQYDFYKQLMYEDMKIFMSGFIQKHQLYSLAEEDILDTDDLSEEEIDRLKRSQRMSQAMTDRNYIKRIGEQ